MASPAAEKRATGIRLDHDRLFGVEIECVSEESRDSLAQRLREAGVEAYEEGYNHETAYYWKLVTDASIVHGRSYGVELVSPPMSGRRGLVQLSKVCRVLRESGATVNNTCGLHVHHDVGDESLHVLRQIAKFYFLHEEEIERFVSATRRDGNNGYCRVPSQIWGSLRTAMRAVDMIDSRPDFSYEWCDRQTAINFQPVASRGTVEFRLHDGTIDYADIAYWIAFTQSIVSAASRGDFKVDLRNRPNQLRMFKMAKVQPIVRWHLYERERMMAYTGPERLLDPDEYEEYEYYEEDEYVEADEDAGNGWTWDGGPLGEYNEDGQFFEECGCAECSRRRRMYGQEATA